MIRREMLIYFYAIFIFSTLIYIYNRCLDFQNAYYNTQYIILYAIQNTITDTFEIDIKKLSYNITLILIVRGILIIEKVLQMLQRILHRLTRDI